MKRAWKSFLVAFAIAAVSLASATAASADAIISIEPSTTNVGVGEAFSLEVRITDAVAVAAYQFSLAYDPAILSVSSVDLGDFMDGSSESPFPVSTGDLSVPGNVASIAKLLLTPEFGVSGNGLLATVHLTAVGPGISAVTPYFDGAAVDGLFDVFFLPIATELVGGTVDVTRGTVPEPTSLLMLALGLGTALERRRRLARGLANS